MLLAAGHEITSQIYSSLIATVGFSTWALHWIVQYVGQYKRYLRNTILHCITCLVPFDLSPVCRNFQLAYNVGEQTKIPRWIFFRIWLWYKQIQFIFTAENWMWEDLAFDLLLHTPVFRRFYEGRKSKQHWWRVQGELRNRDPWLWSASRRLMSQAASSDQSRAPPGVGEAPRRGFLALLRFGMW